MAKVKFTSIVSEIRGKLRGDVFKGYKQGFSLQNKANPPFSNSQRQSDTRALLVYLTGIFGVLSEEEKTLWQIYGSVLIPPISGRNAFTKLNLPILAAPDSGYIINLAPPAEPVVVLPPSDFIYWPNFDNTHQIFWTRPEDLNTVCSIWSARLPGYSFLNRERWVYIGSTPNANQTRLIDNPFLINCPIVLRARSMTPSGTISIFPPRVRLYPRVLNYLDRCEAVNPIFTGNWIAFDLTSERIEGNFAYDMQFAEEPGQIVQFQHTFSSPVDWSDYKSLNCLIKSVMALDPSAYARLIIYSTQGSEEITQGYDFTLAENIWKYLSFELPKPSAVPGTFNIESVTKIMFRINHAYPEGESAEILLDHLHLEEGTSEFEPPPPPPETPLSQGPRPPGLTGMQDQIGTVHWDDPNKIKDEDDDSAMSAEALGSTGVWDNDIRIGMAGVAQGVPRNNPLHWTEELSFFTHGGMYDMWGTELTAEDINSMWFYILISARGSDKITHYLAGYDFGFSIPTGSIIKGIKVEIKKKDEGGKAQVDFGRVTVYYTPPV
jgi:hypothetical protein